MTPSPKGESEKVENCPWCKRDGEDLLASSDGGDDGWFYFVECYCGASGPRCRTRDEANRSWNRVARLFGPCLGNAPEGWEDPRWRVMIECRTCGFEMGAIHEEPANRPTTCPSCEEDRLRADAEKWRELARVFRIAADQAIVEYDELGPSGPVMPGIDKWTRVAVARYSELEKETGGE